MLGHKKSPDSAVTLPGEAVKKITIRTMAIIAWFAPVDKGVEL